MFFCVYANALFRDSGTFYFSDVTLSYDWTSPQNAALWQDGIKTLFDPCPAGWRVPRSGDGELSPWAEFTFEQGEWNDAPALGGMLWTAPLVLHGTAWTPAAGYRVCDYGTFKRIASDGYQWSSAIIGNVKSITVGFNAFGVRILIWDSRASGTSVRCIRE